MSSTNTPFVAIITSEHGKVLSDARGEVTRGIEVVEFACGIPQLLKGEFTEKVASGELYDPALSFQLENGFEVRGVLENYIKDEATDDWSALIAWEDPERSR